jgi:hypothetical protein
MQRNSKLIIQLAACFMIVLGAARAEDKKTDPVAATNVPPSESVAKVENKKIDPSGTWKWNFTNHNGQIREIVLKLKLDGEKLTGTYSGRNGDTAIKEGKLQGDEVSFRLIGKFKGSPYTEQFDGKISGDTIKGSVVSKQGTLSQSHDWGAKREAGEAVKATATNSIPTANSIPK